MSLIMPAAEADAAEFTLRPSLTLSEEYNDNLLLQSDAPTRDYITRVSPSLALHYRTPLWTWDANYTPEYRYYYVNSVYDGVNHTASVRNLTEISSGFIFFEASDEYRRVSTDITRDFTQQSPIVNQADQNTLILHPYLFRKPTEGTAVMLGYRFTDIRFRRHAGINRTDNTAYGETGVVLSTKMTVTFGASLMVENNDVESFNELDEYASIQYRYAENSSVYGRVAPSVVKRSTGTVRQITGLSGISHQFPSMTVATVESSLNYVQDPERIFTLAQTSTVNVRKSFSRSELGLSGSRTEYLNATTNERISLSLEARGSLLYRLSPRTTATGEVRSQDLEDRASAAHTHLSQSSLRIEHRLSPGSTIATSYRFIYSYSPVIEANTYIDNSVVAELRIEF